MELHPSRRGEDAAPPAITAKPLRRDEDNEDAMTREGGCLCGAVRFKAEGEPLNVRICHCRTCQKAMGSPFFARALFDQRALTVAGETARYPSRTPPNRGFAKPCATRCFPSPT